MFNRIKILVHKRLTSKNMSTSYFEDKDHTILYQKYRPVPPSALFESTINFLTEKLQKPFELAIDFGCGSGQSTMPLASYFNHVIGIDISEEQINRTKDLSIPSNVSFKLTSPNKIVAKDSSVDLVTAGSAIQWLDLDIFYPELDRVLKPNGVLAFYTPIHPNIYHPDYPELNSEYQQFIHAEINSYSLKQSNLSQNQYCGIKLPYAEAKYYRDDNCFEMSKEMPLPHVFDYVRTWSAYRMYLKERKNNQDVLNILQKSILQKLGSQSAEDVIIKVVWNYCLILTRKPTE